MKKMFIFLMVLIVLVSTSCVGNKKLWDEAYRNRVQIGDTITKAIDLFGRPNQKAIQKNGKGDGEFRFATWVSTKGRKAVSVTAFFDEKGIITNIQYNDLN